MLNYRTRTIRNLFPRGVRELDVGSRGQLNFSLGACFRCGFIVACIENQLCQAEKSTQTIGNLHRKTKRRSHQLAASHGHHSVKFMSERGAYHEVDVEWEEGIAGPDDAIEEASKREGKGHVLDAFGLNDHFLHDSSCTHHKEHF